MLALPDSNRASSAAPSGRPSPPTKSIGPNRRRTCIPRRAGVSVLHRVRHWHSRTRWRACWRRRQPAWRWSAFQLWGSWNIPRMPCSTPSTIAGCWAGSLPASQASESNQEPGPWARPESARVRLHAAAGCAPCEPRQWDFL